ncbi:MAG: ATP-binding cassette domain-containing protein [Actinobacteria bacterium]|nr:ATP-binding cassette domain-containing protein [Actinomycetota bacterium]
MAVDGLSMKVKRGEVYGFVGPNGAGKTTTLRMLLGLVRPTSGSCTVLGRKPGSPEALARLGSLVETPAFYPFLSGRDNLRVMARHADVDYSRIGPVLEEVELSKRAGSRFKTYSLGMKQRLGMAAALLKDPELLILDEPTNGLDPAGMAEMRRLIRQLGRDNRTVLLSSHLMGELEQICDRVGVVKAGKVVTEGTMDDLRSGQRLRLQADPIDKARLLLASMSGIGKMESMDTNVLIVEADPSRAAEINRLLVTSGIEVSEISTIQLSLESVFLDLTEAPDARHSEPLAALERSGNE